MAGCVLEAPDGVAEQVLSNSELMCIVFEYLKTLTLNESKLTIEDGDFTLPRSWTGPFARLARVNRAFWVASTDVLWQNMSSVEPFFRVLLNSDPTEGEDKGLHPLSYRSGGPSAEDWERFRLYSSKTIRLSPTLPPSVEMDPSWVLYLAMSKHRLELLFPRLEHLYLTRSDPLATFISLSVAPVVQSIFLHPELESHGENMAALTTALSHSATNLSTLDIGIHLPASPTLLNVSRIFWLKELTLELNAKENDVDIGILDGLSNLESLSIEQLDARPPLLPDAPDITEPLARPSSLTSLRKLSVIAGSWMHWKVASTSSPHNLQNLLLQVKPNKHDVDMVFAPLAAAVHVQRNQSLKTFEFFSLASDFVESDLDQILGGDTSYNDVTPLFTGISRLRDLKRLVIVEIPFSQADTPSLLLDAAINLPSLRTLWLKPSSIPDVEYDTTNLPNLRRLSELRDRLPLLKTLVTHMNIEDIPPIPRESTSVHPLRTLGNPHVTLDMIPRYTLEQKTALVDYLLALFPGITDLAADRLWKAGTVKNAFSKSIKDILESRRRLKGITL